MLSGGPLERLEFQQGENETSAHYTEDTGPRGIGSDKSKTLGSVLSWEVATFEIFRRELFGFRLGV